ncbi:hypothetical protein HF1_10610 [Mycoplasma haemofelis str. Langford 1]|uniref:Uncharacterized protein n=1 Tax=Mycoplasma haemofelis (strain Langford 1) TaxID=941640 RepID=E8ZIU8_MYCHL|nr:hypothetical protein [Mycoplasma haemofelis]CBY93069.1 hypothetical protein HF1_10610 [Mycoplasma haemofelis str. Langford 1]
MSDFGVAKALCGSIAAGIGTLGIKSVLLSDTPKEDSLSTKKVSFDFQESPEQLEAEEDSAPEEEAASSLPIEQVPQSVEVKEEKKVPVIPKCTFYVLEEPKRVNGVRVVKKVLRKIEENQDQFLKNKSQAFINDIKGICPTPISKSQDIYVWQESGKWIYSKDISTRNWLIENNIDIPEQLRISSNSH